MEDLTGEVDTEVPEVDSKDIEVKEEEGTGEVISKVIPRTIVSSSNKICTIESSDLFPVFQQVRNKLQVWRNLVDSDFAVAIISNGVKLKFKNSASAKDLLKKEHKTKIYKSF